MIKLAKEIIPFFRSIASPENKKTLDLLKKKGNNIQIRSFKSDTKKYDWKVPREWIIKDAFIKNSNGKHICNIKDEPLSVVNYSVAIDTIINLKKLKKKIHTIKEQPNAIPYVTSYYNKDWGFCLAYKKLKKLKNENYHVYIDSKFKKGKMVYGEAFFKGTSKKEILFVTNICHPQLANNEVAGPVILTYLTNFIKNFKNKKYSYRILFIPETIGSIAYINKNLKSLQKKLLSGFVITCFGDNRNFTFLPSKYGNTYTDRVAERCLKKYVKNYKKYSWLIRGSDERQFCSPLVNLPVCSIMRTGYRSYAEYHSSLDKIGKVVSNKGLKTSLNFLKKLILTFEKNQIYISSKYCEPMFKKYRIKKNISRRNYYNFKVNDISNVLSYCDGTNDLEDISKYLTISKKKVNNILLKLLKLKLIKKI